MIIDARKSTSGKNGRPYTMSAAVGDAMDDVAIGDSVIVHGLVDIEGKEVPKTYLSVYVHKLSNGRKFATRTVKGTDQTRLIRIA